MLCSASSKANKRRSNLKAFTRKKQPLDHRQRNVKEGQNLQTSFTLKLTDGNNHSLERAIIFFVFG